MENKKEIKLLKKEINKYKILGVSILIVLLFAAVLFYVLTAISNNMINNEKVMYCELANMNAKVANGLIPYLEMYMDDSIETISGINKTLAHILTLQLIKSRGLELPMQDCPIEKCNGPFLGPVDREICDLILEIKYEVRDL